MTFAACDRQNAICEIVAGVTDVLCVLCATHADDCDSQRSQLRVSVKRCARIGALLGPCEMTAVSRGIAFLLLSFCFAPPGPCVLVSHKQLVTSLAVRVLG